MQILCNPDGQERVPKRELLYTGDDTVSIWGISDGEVPGVEGRRIIVSSPDASIYSVAAPMYGFCDLPTEGNPGRTPTRIACAEPPERMESVPELFKAFLHGFPRQPERRNPAAAVCR